MRVMSATEASRSFAALLDAAERGESIIVTRGGRRIATIGPAPVANGADLIALLREAPVDDGFADDVRSARDVAESDGPAWPAD